MDYLAIIEDETQKLTTDLRKFSTKITEEWYKNVQLQIKEHNELLLFIRENQKSLEVEKAQILEETVNLDAIHARDIKAKNEAKMSVEKLKSDLLILKKEIENKYKEMENIKLKSEPTPRDKEYYENAKTKLTLFKEFKLRFDFSVPESQYIQGHIVSNNSEIKYFRFDGHMELDEIREKLWELITKISLEDKEEK